MSAILQLLKLAGQGLDELTAERLERRARLVEEDFAAIGLKYEVFGEHKWVPGCPVPLPLARYRLLGSECDINKATGYEHHHTEMSGTGLDQECLLYFSKISEWAHTNIPHLWPGKLKKELRDPNSHSNTLNEVWWLSRLVGADFANAKYAVPVDPLKPKGPNVDWEVDLRFGVRVIIEAKRRPTDLTRSIDSAELKRLSIFDALNKFREPHPPHSVNIGCVRLYGPIGIDVRLAAKSWLAENRHVSAVAFCAQNPDRNLAFAVVCRDGLAYVQELFSRPDREDERYVVLVQHTVEIPWLNLPKLR